MSQPSGAHSAKCRYCGKHYRLTNWMKRRNLGFDKEGRLLYDTHQASCYRKQQMALAYEFAARLAGKEKP